MLSKYVKFVAQINAAFYLTTSPFWVLFILKMLSE